MDNKKDKTFADLFSSFSSDEYLDEVNDGDEQIEQNMSKDNKNESASLTFDSLFDKVDNENFNNEESATKENENMDQEDLVFVEDRFETDEKEEGLNSLFERSSQDDSSKKIDLEGSNFTNKDSTLESIVDDRAVSFSQMNSKFNDSDALLDEKYKKTKEGQTYIGDELFNKSIFQEQKVDKVVGEEKESFDTLNEENSENKETDVFEGTSFNSIFEEKKDKLVSNSLFETDVQGQKVDEVVDEEKESFDTLNEKNSENKETDVFEDTSFNSIFEEKKENLESNPLFENEKEEAILRDDVSLSEKVVDDADKDYNPFFGDASLEDEKITLEENEQLVSDNSFSDSDNIFFGESGENVIGNDSKVVSSEKDASEDFLEEPKFEEKKIDSSEKEISPFFVEETKVEENPLFLDKVNLVENVEDTKKISNINIDGVKHFDVKVVKKKEPLTKFIFGVISYAIFIWLLLIGVAMLVYVLDIKIRAAKGDYSSPKFNAYVVLTGSMLPEIQVYDVVVTKKVDAAKLEEGDVITFASADTRFLNTIITHRIIKKNYDSKTKTYSFQTRGDNNNVADNALVPQDNIYGKVILKIPKLGYLQEFLASDGGWIIVILIPCLAVISYDIVKLAKGLKKRKSNNIRVQK